jgi:hypothetical protein
MRALPIGLALLAAAVLLEPVAGVFGVYGLHALAFFLAMLAFRRDPLLRRGILPAVVVFFFLFGLGMERSLVGVADSALLAPVEDVRMENLRAGMLQGLSFSAAIVGTVVLLLASRDRARAWPTMAPVLAALGAIFALRLVGHLTMGPGWDAGTAVWSLAGWGLWLLHAAMPLALLAYFVRRRRGERATEGEGAGEASPATTLLEQAAPALVTLK